MNVQKIVIHKLPDLLYVTMMNSHINLTHIEHVLDMLNRQIRENHHPFHSLQEVENALIIEWNAIPQYKFQEIIRGMQKRCIATITANGA
jgi:hypothetical protein